MYKINSRRSSVVIYQRRNPLYISYSSSLIIMDPRLFNAAVAGDIEVLHQLLQENPFVLSDYNLVTLSENPLNIAVKAGQLRFVQQVIKTAPELVKELNQEGFRPLDIASAYGHVEIVREILVTCDDTEVCRLQGRDGRTPIHHAAMNGKVQVMDELLNVCPDCVKDVTALGETALHLAVKCFKFDAFVRLTEWLEKLALRDVLNWKDKEGSTVLHSAVSRKQLQTVEFMLNESNPMRGVIEVNAMNTKGLTAMDILDILLESFTDVQLRKILQRSGGQGAPELRITSEIESSEDVATHKNSQDRKNPAQKPKNWLQYLRFHEERDSPAQARDALLVVSALIATITFQAGINPPTHIFEVSYEPTYSSQPKSTISRDPNSIAPSVQNDLQELSRQASMVSLTVFLVANSIALSTSMSIIDYLRKGLPFQRELRISGFFMMFAYGWSLGYTKPTGLVKDICLGVSLLVPLFIRLIPDLARTFVKH